MHNATVDMSLPADSVGRPVLRLWTVIVVTQVDEKGILQKN